MLVPAELCPSHYSAPHKGHSSSTFPVARRPEYQQPVLPCMLTFFGWLVMAESSRTKSWSLSLFLPQSTSLEPAMWKALAHSLGGREQKRKADVLMSSVDFRCILYLEVCCKEPTDKFRIAMLVTRDQAISQSVPLNPFRLEQDTISIKYMAQWRCILIIHFRHCPMVLVPPEKT